MGVCWRGVGMVFAKSVIRSNGKYLLMTLLCVWPPNMSWPTMISKVATVSAVVEVMVHGVR